MAALLILSRVDGGRCHGSDRLVIKSARRRNEFAMLKVGDVAPEFELPALAGEARITIRSQDYLGRQNLIVTFHPLDWTPT